MVGLNAMMGDGHGEVGLAAAAGTADDEPRLRVFGEGASHRDGTCIAGALSRFGAAPLGFERGKGEVVESLQPTNAPQERYPLLLERIQSALARHCHTKLWVG